MAVNCTVSPSQISESLAVAPATGLSNISKISESVAATHPLLASVTVRVTVTKPADTPFKSTSVEFVGGSNAPLPLLTVHA